MWPRSFGPIFAGRYTGKNRRTKVAQRLKRLPRLHQVLRVARKVARRLRAKKKPGDNGKNQRMDDELAKRVKDAQQDMEGHPGEHAPARPVLTLQQKHTKKQRKQFGELDQDNVIPERIARHQLPQMKYKTDHAHQKVDAADERYRQGAFVHPRIT